MTAYKKYPRYKNSGVEWLGDVPEHWEVERIYGLFHESNIRGGIQSEMLTVTQTDGILKQSEYMEKYDRRLSQSVSADYSKYRRVSRGEIVYNKMRLWQGAIGIARTSGIVSPAYVVMRPSRTLNTFYYTRLFESSTFVSEAGRHSQGLVDDMNSCRFEDLRTSYAPLPPLPEQHAIAEYLDRETAALDALIEKKERLMELLEEKRQALISHAVTKGLNPNAPMKDSGVEWLGEVPAHWEVKKLKWVALLKSGSTITADTIKDRGKYPVYGGNGLRGYTDAYTHEGVFPLIGRQGALCGNVNYAEGCFWASEHAVVVTPYQSVNIEWLGELLRSMDLNQYSVAAAQPGLAVERIIELAIPVPLLKEQTEISNYLHVQIKNTDTLLITTRRSIDLLKEKRSALITAVVTGQVDVRDEVA